MRASGTPAVRAVASEQMMKPAPWSTLALAVMVLV